MPTFWVVEDMSAYVNQLDANDVQTIAVDERKKLHCRLDLEAEEKGIVRYL